MRRRLTLGGSALFAVAICVSVWSVPTRLAAQLTTTRGLFVAGVSDTSRQTRFVSRAEVFTALEASTRRAPGYLSSDYRIGLVVDLVRFRNGAALGMVLGSEMSVAPDNSIGFDPRGVVWEEQLGYYRGGGALSWNAGAFLRCRHDVDNGTPIEPLDSAPLIFARGRIIALHGVQAGVATPEWRPTQRLSIRAASQLEGYVHHNDIRTPDSHIEPDWRDALAAATATIRVRATVNDRVAAYARSWESHVLFASAAGSAVRSNGRLEVGVHIAGPAGGGDAFYSRERTFDDAMTVLPRRMVSSTIGIRVAGPTLF